MNSISDYENQYGTNTILRKLKKMYPGSYNEFIEYLYEEIERITNLFYSQRKRFTNEGEMLKSEDEITQEISNLLNCSGYNSSNETNSNGHVDLTVIKSGYEWKGEAKIHGAYDHVKCGLEQILQYCNGNESKAGVLIYISREDSLSIMKEYKNRIECYDRYPPSSEVLMCVKQRISSSHKHEATGNKIEITHFPFALYYKHYSTT
ncbi:MAG: hypothetical protein NE327_22585 [Lentisphaeraceae bacterium]|nr:hypothetical protein [Lentisphaeraceae bacterium]